MLICKFKVLLQRALIMAAVLTSTGFAHSQVAVKTNLLYDATTTPNLGVEVGVGSRSTVQVVYGLNPWTFHSAAHGDRKAKHWVLMPEWRHWFCSRFSGHFIGVHGMVGQFNAGNVDIPLPGGFVGGRNLAMLARNNRVEGGFVGCGFTYGYQWILSRHWNLEAEVGVGYDYSWYDRFNCGECGRKTESNHTNYLGLTKLGLSLMYLF